MLLPALVLLIALGQADKRHMRFDPMVRIALGEKAGLAEIAAQRKSHIKKLLAIAQNDRTEIVPLLLSLEALGELRATEAAKPLVDILGRNVSPVGRDMTADLTLPYDDFPKRLGQTIVAIGLPCREPILRQLGELHGPAKSRKLKELVFPRRGWKLVSEVEYRRRLVQALRRIEGKACAVFLVKARLATEKDERRRSNLTNALKLLEALPQPASQPSTKSAESTDPYGGRYRIVHRQIKILKTIPDDPKRATNEQARAMAVLSEFRSSEAKAVRELLRIVLIKEPLRETAIIAGSGRRQRIGELSALEDYPAARALVSIGMPAVLAIRGDLERTEAKKQDKTRLEVYSAILFRVLWGHARDFMLAEKKQAPKSMVKNYDRLLALPYMAPSQGEGRRLSPAETEELRKKFDPQGRTRHPG